ncbi:MAG: flagellar basal body L-ring protein FlgH [Exilibacterium sp.]
MKTWLLAAALASLCACVIQPPPRPGDPYYAPVIAPGKMQAPASDGSLYPREYGYQPSNGLSLFNDSKAHRIGDIITITLNERTVSSKSSTVSIDKDNETTVDEDDDTLGTLLGTRPSFKNLSLLTNRLRRSAQQFTGQHYRHRGRCAAQRQPGRARRKVDDPEPRRRVYPHQRNRAP